MYYAISHLASAFGFVILALPYAGSHDALHSLDNRLAHPAPLANVAAAPATIDQRPQTRIIRPGAYRTEAGAGAVRSSRPGSHGRQPERRAGGAWPVEPDSGTRPGPGSESSAGNSRGSAPKAGTRVVCGSPVDIWIAGPVTSRDDVQPEPPCQVSVPSLGGNQLDDVRRQLARANLQVGKVNTRESDCVRGTVISQSPISGTRVKCGSPIDVVVAIPIPQRGDDVPSDPMCPVPNLTGNQLGDVRQLLARETGRRQGQHARVRWRSRRRHRPVARVRNTVKRGSPVDVVIAIPVPPRTDDVPPVPPCVVPSLTGNQLDDVRRLLARTKLEIGRVNTRESDGVRGTVIAQLPASGTRVRCGSPIDVVVAIPVPQRPDDVQPCLVPDLTGSGAAETRRQLARARLELGTVNGRQADRPVATVLDQSPRPGRAVTCGSQVDLVIAVAPPKPEPPVVDCRVPNVAGDDVSEVKRKLAQENLLLGAVQTGRPISGPAPWSIRSRQFRAPPSSADHRSMSGSRRRCRVRRSLSSSAAIRKRLQPCSNGLD